MSRAFHMGIMAAVAVHMVFGCCWRHAHAYERPSDTATLTVAASCAHDHGSAEPGRFCDHPFQHQQCHAGRCVFTRPDANDTPDLSIGHGCLNPACVSPGLPPLSGIDRADSSLGELGPPIPLHLLNQVLLI